MISIASFVVEGAGTKDVDGTYTRTTVQCAGADVYRKASTSFALLRRATDDWCLVDLHSKSTTGWTLRCEELYKASFGGGVTVTPPLLGWREVSGRSPAPIIRATKGAHLGLSLTATLSSGTLAPPEAMAWSTFGASRGATLLARTGSSLLLRGRSGQLSASSPSLPGVGAQQSAPAKAAAAKADKDSENFMCCYRVVLMRPSARCPWGFVWDKSAHTRTGARVVESISEGSPLSRWNFWQDLRGRPDLCVQATDQLVRVDGKWAWHDSEIGEQDGDQASDAVEGRVQSEAQHPLVLDFARPTVRAPVPVQPQLDVIESEATLVIDWTRTKKGTNLRGWALCLQDVNSGAWFAVDGATSMAIPLNPRTNDIGVMQPEVQEVRVSEGLPSGRTYAACIACLTSVGGWTAFSPLSRPLSLPKFRNVHREQKAPVEEDWPERYRFACPSRLVPGASAPVELASGTRELLGKSRRLHLEMALQNPQGALPGNVRWGLRLHMGEVQRGERTQEALTVYRVEPGLAAHRWNQAQRHASIHGASLPMRILEGDVLVRVNGLTQPAAMLREVRRGPAALNILVERETEGPIEVEESIFDDEDEDVIRLDNRLDQDAAKAAEEIEWIVLLPQQEGVVASTMVGTGVQKLEDAVKSGNISSAYRSLFKEAEGRLMLEHLRPKLSCIVALLDAQQGDLSPFSDGSWRLGGGSPSRSLKRVLSSTSSKGGGDGNSKDDQIFLAVRLAMADPEANEKRLADAICLLGQASKDVRSSQAGLALARRAKSLLKLWTWRRQCEQSRIDLAQALQDVLQHEARGPPPITDTPPFDLSELHKAVERATPYSSEFLFEFGEASESLTRLKLTNERCMAQRRMEVAASDPKEHPSILEAAVREAEAAGVNEAVLSATRRNMKDVIQRKMEEACHDDLFAATQDLEAALKRKEMPPAGTSEQKHVRQALAGCGLPSNHPLVIKASGLLKDWETKHFALRAEIRLSNAEKRCAAGFKMTEPEAGPVLASTIAEVAELGADAALLERAKATLAKWRDRQVIACLENLSQAINAKSEEFLKEAIRAAQKAGVPEPYIDNANQKLMRLRMEEEVNKTLEKAMDAGDADQLEAAIQSAHDAMFVEEECQPLLSAVLQVHLRLWASEFGQALKDRKPGGLEALVPVAEATLHRAKEAIKDMYGNSDVGEVVSRSLEREIRGLDLMLPKFADFMAVHGAEDELRRVLGAVEKYAQDLPQVIARGRKQVAKGLDSELVQQCAEHLKNYEATVKDLQSAITRPDVPLMELKSVAIKARLAGADVSMVERALVCLSVRDPELHRYTTIQLELLLALTEADDIVELDTDSRFQRLEAAADKGRKLSPPLSAETLAEVDEVYLALAAEQGLKFAIRDGEAALANRWSRTEDVSACVGKLEQACLSAQLSALEGVKEALIPPAEKLQDMLETEADARMQTATELNATRLSSPTNDLIIALRNAREAFVHESALLGFYNELRKRKLEFIAKDWRAACVSGNHQLALSYWHRGVALEASKERSGDDWLQDHLPLLESKWTDGITLAGEFKKAGGGSFGSQTWRENPYFFVRPLHDEELESSQARATTPGGPIQVTVYAVECGGRLATLSVHAVRNKKQVAFAGVGTTLMPGFEVLAASNEEQDIPHCSFQVDVQSEELQPVFIVPSVAVGEEGPFKLLVEASRPVEVVEVGPADRISWRLVAEEQVEWATSQPHSIAMGGGRPETGAPRLSWYRNPQFIVKADSEDDDDSDSGCESSVLSEGMLFVLLVPEDRRRACPAAIHLLKNKEGSEVTERRGLAQNPWHHEMLASSCSADGAEYSSDAELGAVCAVPRGFSEPIITVPSLESRSDEATYKIQFFSTVDVTVTRA